MRIVSITLHSKTHLATRARNPRRSVFALRPFASQSSVPELATRIFCIKYFLTSKFKTIKWGRFNAEL